MDDLYPAAGAVRANLRLIALRRDANWPVPLAQDQPDSIWQSTKQDDRIQSEFMRYLLAEYVQPARSDWWQYS